MKANYLAEPCRNYCILASILISSDPKDGREKLVLSTHSVGGKGRIIFTDMETETSEFVELEDEGAHALLYLQDLGLLIVGTCTNYGYLQCLDLKTRKWKKSLHIDGQTYIWNFARGKDGCVYGSNYPGCILLKYDPVAETLTSVGRVGDVEENLYSRWVYANADGNIIVSTGYHTPQAFCYNVETNEFVKFGIDGDEIREVTNDYILSFHKNNTYRFYDPKNLELIAVSDGKSDPDEKTAAVLNQAVLQKMKDLKNPPRGAGFLKLKDGRMVKPCGQELLVLDGDRDIYMKIPSDPPPTGILTIALDENGKIWGSSNFGQTIFSYDKQTNQYENTLQVTQSGGEVYGICPKDGKIFLTAYAGGDHIVYDPRLPWDQRGNKNPVALESVQDRMVRPEGKSVIGPDGNIYTGWVACYGTYGGGISRINPQTYQVDSWYPIMGEQSIVSVCSGKNHIFALTSGIANGLPFKDGKFYLLKLDCDCNIIWKKQYDLGTLLHKVIVVGDYVLVTLDDKKKGQVRIDIFQEDTMEELSSIKWDNSENSSILDAIAYDDNTMIAFFTGHATRIRIPDGTALEECALEGEVRSSVKGMENEVYFTINSKLYQLEF